MRAQTKFGKASHNIILRTEMLRTFIRLINIVNIECGSN
jgi:hypothetical protein